MKFHKDMRTTNLLGGACGSDDGWNNEDLECLQCGGDGENNQVQQILVLFKQKFGSSSRGNDRQPASSSR